MVNRFKMANLTLAGIASAIIVILGIVQGVRQDPVTTPYLVATGVVLVILGLVIGFLNITKKETTGFLVAMLAILAVGITAVTGVIPEALGTLTLILESTFGFLIILVTPVVIVVGLKTIIMSLSKGD